MSTPSNLPARQPKPQAPAKPSRDEFSRRELRHLNVSIQELTSSIEQLAADKRQEAESSRQARLFGEVVFVIKAVLAALHC